MWLEQRKGYKESEIVITFTNTEWGKARERERLEATLTREEK